MTTGAIRSWDILLTGGKDFDEYTKNYDKSRKESMAGIYVESLYNKGVLSFDEISQLSSLNLNDPSFKQRLLDSLKGNENLANSYIQAIDTFRNGEDYGKVSLQQTASGFSLKIKNENNNLLLKQSALNFVDPKYGLLVDVLDMSAVGMIAMMGGSAIIGKGVSAAAKASPTVDALVTTLTKSKVNPFYWSNKLEKQITNGLVDLVGEKAEKYGQKV